MGSFVSILLSFEKAIFPIYPLWLCMISERASKLMLESNRTNRQTGHHLSDSEFSFTIPPVQVSQDKETSYALNIYEKTTTIFIYRRP